MKKAPLIGIITQNIARYGDTITMKGRCLVHISGSSKAPVLKDIGVRTALDAGAVTLKLGPSSVKLPKGYTLTSYVISVDVNKALELDIQNRLILTYRDFAEGRILYNIADLKKGKNNNSEVFIENGTAIYFRQNKHNSLTLTVRQANMYDTSEGQALIARALKQSKHERGDIILMYEKECERYEESASVVYEKLMDLGIDNVYYVVNPDNPRIQNLPDKYRSHFVDKGSLDHLAKFFACSTIIATESIDHAVQLRIANKAVQDKINSDKMKYVFLQHGVMYMVSLNSELRIGFRNTNYAFHRVVVSSQLEADHFIELGGMNPDNLYISGLPKFDQSLRNDDADRIVIMPTWRRWETNVARNDLDRTGYYQLTKCMFDAVPDELKSRTIVLPHPLMAEYFSKDSLFKDNLALGRSYDEVLRECDILITDYSSIAYDAYYRGAKVIFCWQDKEECMIHYGDGTKLMLNEDNVFGRICMNGSEITDAIDAYYMKPQPADELAKYRRIVEFSDNRNTERVLEYLKKDGII